MKQVTISFFKLKVWNSCLIKNGRSDKTYLLEHITAAVFCSLDVVVKLDTEINNNEQISLQQEERN